VTIDAVTAARTDGKPAATSATDTSLGRDELVAIWQVLVARSDGHREA